MPTNRRRRVSAVRHNFDSPRVIEHLMTGEDWPFLPGPKLSERQLSEAWEAVGDELLARWFSGEPYLPGIHDCGGEPFRRPWGWWRFEQRMDEPTGEDDEVCFFDADQEREFLVEHAELLSDAERAALATEGHDNEHFSG